MTTIKFNYNFTEKKLETDLVKVTNNLGRKVLYGELVYLDGFFGEVRDYDGIANAATGYINIEEEREVSTGQVEATDTFVVNSMLYFTPGGAGAAGKIVDTWTKGSVPIGVCLEQQGGAGTETAVTFRPIAQQAPARPASTVQVSEVVIDADATAGVAAGLPLGARIIDVWDICTAASAGGTAVVKDAGGGVVHTAIVMAVDQVVTRVSVGFDDTKRIVNGAYKVFAGQAGDRGIVYISYLL